MTSDEECIEYRPKGQVRLDKAADACYECAKERGLQRCFDCDLHFSRSTTCEHSQKFRLEAIRKMERDLKSRNLSHNIAAARFNAWMCGYWNQEAETKLKESMTADIPPNVSFDEALAEMKANLEWLKSLQPKTRNGELFYVSHFAGEAAIFVYIKKALVAYLDIVVAA